MIETERKFLIVSAAFKDEASSKEEYVQGYLNSASERTVRIRKTDKSGFLTIKGESSKEGLSRFEWEKEISRDDAEELLSLAEPGVIEKIRYKVEVGTHLFEVDEFLGENKGLYVAEIELDFEDEEFEKPLWLGQEVTGQKKYYNSYLAKNPFRKW